MHQNELGFAVFNYDEIIKKYEEFVQNWKRKGCPELYFVTMDIEKCYDSVGVNKLKELLHKTELLEKDYYLLTALVLKRKNNVVVDDKEKGDVVK
jgi:telomerase reverse transcriptase